MAARPRLADAVARLLRQVSRLADQTAQSLARQGSAGQGLVGQHVVGQGTAGDADIPDHLRDAPEPWLHLLAQRAPGERRRALIEPPQDIAAPAFPDPPVRSQGGTSPSPAPSDLPNVDAGLPQPLQPPRRPRPPRMALAQPPTGAVRASAERPLVETELGGEFGSSADFGSGWESGPPWGSQSWSSSRSAGESASPRASQSRPRSSSRSSSRSGSGAAEPWPPTDISTDGARVPGGSGDRMRGRWSDDELPGMRGDGESRGRRGAGESRGRLVGGLLGWRGVLGRLSGRPGDQGGDRGAATSAVDVAGVGGRAGVGMPSEADVTDGVTTTSVMSASEAQGTPAGGVAAGQQSSDQDERYRAGDGRGSARPAGDARFHPGGPGWAGGSAWRDGSAWSRSPLSSAGAATVMPGGPTWSGVPVVETVPAPWPVLGASDPPLSGQPDPPRSGMLPDGADPWLALPDDTALWASPPRSDDGDRRHRLDAEQAGL